MVVKVYSKSAVYFGIGGRVVVGLSLEEYVAQKMSDPEFAEAYRQTLPNYDIARQVIHLRQSLDLTQQGLAEKVGTKQSSISRLESMNSTPSVSFLQRVATALNADLRIEFVPRE